MVAGQRLVAFHGADAESGEIVVALRIHARHFGGLAADQGAACLPAAVRDRGDDALGDSALELAGREIIEEEQRLGALDDEVVDAHRDQIDTDAVMAVEVDRELQLGADAIIGGDQQRIAIAGGL
jgi:hypothetical protein